MAGGWTWATHAERLERGRPGEVVPVAEIPAEVAERLAAPRPPLAGLGLDAPRLMAIVNVTPDSFSDGGRGSDAAIAHGRTLLEAGADLLDIGGESTRPGAVAVPAAEEAARILPVIRALAGRVPLSVDTRKAAVAEAALAAGAGMVNDVSALGFDPALGPLVARAGVPVCLMHAQGDPETMQAAPRYDDVLIDVYESLAARVAAAEAMGIPRACILVDPGIGFGKTLAHNLALLAGLSAFHGLGAGLLIGVSRKRFIGTLSGVEPAGARVMGSVAAALAATLQGVQILRVHDMAATRQALSVWRAITETP